MRRLIVLDEVVAFWALLQRHISTWWRRVALGIVDLFLSHAVLVDCPYLECAGGG